MLLKKRKNKRFRGIHLPSLSPFRLLPDEGVWNPCLLPEDMPETLLKHDLVQASWAGLDPGRMRDMHIHLAGMGQNGSGITLNPAMRSIFHPVQFIKTKFFLNAGCVRTGNSVDKNYIQRLHRLTSHFPPGAKFMLLAFDHTYNEKGEKDLSGTALYVPNEYANSVALSYPARFEWIASVHPYRKEAPDILVSVAKKGAKAVKWLPPSMGIDPDSPLCDPFYETLARLNLPLLSHGGKERSLHGAGVESYGNPLLLKRALMHGCRVIVAHCAAMGKGVDLDKGKNGPFEDNFTLFSRMMEDARFEGLLFGDISALTQSDRVDALAKIVERTHLHHRLLNGSDYPLPGVMPLFSMDLLVQRGFISDGEGKILSKIRRYNPLLFNHVLKRTLTLGGKKLLPSIFQADHFFEGFRMSKKGS